MEITQHNNNVLDNNDSEFSVLKSFKCDNCGNIQAFWFVRWFYTGTNSWRQTAKNSFKLIECNCCQHDKHVKPVSLFD